MLGIVKRDEYEFDKWIKKQAARAAEMLEGWGIEPREALATEVGWLLALGKFEGKNLEFDAFQMAWLMNDSRMRSINKARQVGFSFEIACETTSRCHQRERYTAVCVSYNLNDAKEKIQKIKELHDELPLEFQKQMVVDSKTEVAFCSNSSKRRVSRVVSNPAKAPRGKTGDVYLDELAHCQNDRIIYQGATALIARSGGQLTVGSTPLGKRGTFYEVHSNLDGEYPKFWRQDVPWWLCRQFSKVYNDPALISLCSTLPTEVRVERYGTEAIKLQFSALPIEDFQQEYELVFQDEKVAFFPYELLLPCFQKEVHEIPVYDNIAQLAAVAPKLGRLYAGFDVGRTNHPSELHIFEKKGATYVLRYTQAWKNVAFPEQREALEKIIRTLGEHLRRFRIDTSGLGRQLGEELEKKFGRRIECTTFTNKIKEELANNVKILFQERNFVFPKDRSIITQIHSIKQKITASNNTIFDAERNRHHHADKFWSIALACKEKRNARAIVPTEVNVRVLGEDKKLLVAERKKLVVPEPPKSLVENLFTTPEEVAEAAAAKAYPTGTAIMSEAVEIVALRKLSNAELVARGKAVATSMRVWKRSGDEPRVKKLQAEYKRIRREVARRKAASVA